VYANGGEEIFKSLIFFTSYKIIMLLKCLTWRKVTHWNKPIKILIKCVDEKGDIYLVVIYDYVNDFYVKLNAATSDDFCQFMSENRFDITHIEQVNKRLYYGGANCDVLYVKSKTFSRAIERKINAHKMQIVEGDINVFTKFFASHNIEPCGFVDIDTSSISESNYASRLLTRNIVHISYLDIKGSQQSFEYHDKIFYFDIECENIHIAVEEDDDDDDDDEDDHNSTVLKTDLYKPTHINMISCVLSQHDKTDLYIYSTYEFDIETVVDHDIFSSIPIKIKCDDEKDLLTKFFQLIHTLNPDIVSGYNILGFDWYQVINSAMHYNIDQDIYMVSGHDFFQDFPEFKGIYRDNKDVQSGSGKGRTESFMYLEHPFFNNVDIIKYTQKMFKMPNYTLKTVSSTLLNNTLTKLDISYVVIRTVFAFLRKLNLASTFDEGLALTSDIEIHVYIDDIKNFYDLTQKTTTLRELKESTRHICGKIAKYCIVDSLLCSLLNKKVEIMRTSKEIANLNRVTLEDVIMRGVTFRIISSLYKYAHEENIILDLPTGDFKDENDKLDKNLQGAAVLNPLKGYYNGICTLDFASLYPCILIYFNLCASTLSFTKSENCTEIKCENVRPYYFTKERIGILPKIMSDMMIRRRAFKSEMKTLHKHSEEYIILDCKQQALKVTMNSAYGYTGSSYQPRAVLPIAQSTTTKGRDLLFQVKDFLMKRHWNVIYGDTDSNLVQPPIFSRYGTFNSKTLTKNILMHCDNFKKHQPYEKPSTLVQVIQPIDQKDSIDNFSIDLSMYKLGDVINISKEIDDYLCRICTDISAEISAIINEQYNSNFDLEFEDAMEHWAICKKKLYIGQKYCSDDLILKGVLSVKSSYSKAEGRVYNNVARAKFNGLSMSQALVDECTLLMTDFNYGSFIANAKFRTFTYYAEKLMDFVLDIEGNVLASVNSKLSKKHLARLKINPSKTLGLKCAWNIHERGETPPEYSQIEYVFTEHHIGESYTKKADCVLDYERFHHLKDVLKIKHMLYLDRLIPQTATLFEICNETIEEYDKYSCYIRCVNYFKLELPPLYTILDVIESIPQTLDDDTIVYTTKLYNEFQKSNYLSDNKIDYRVLFAKRYNQPGLIKLKFKANKKLIWVPLHERVKEYVIKMRNMENIKSIFTPTLSNTRTSGVLNDHPIKNDLMYIYSELVMRKYTATPLRLFTKKYANSNSNTALSHLNNNIKRDVTTYEVVALLKKNAIEFITQHQFKLTTEQLKTIAEYFNITSNYEHMSIEVIKCEFIELLNKNPKTRYTDRSNLIWTDDFMNTIAVSRNLTAEYNKIKEDVEVNITINKGLVTLLSNKTNIPSPNILKDISTYLNTDLDYENNAWINMKKIRQYFKDAYMFTLSPTILGATAKPGSQISDPGSTMLNDQYDVTIKSTMLNKKYFPPSRKYEKNIAKAIKNQFSLRIYLNKDIITYCHQF
jgi:DNA polymerase elongation subunit (family B)